MWIAGFVTLLALLAGGVALINRFDEEATDPGHWDPASHVTSYLGLVGPLASFSVVVAIFVANLSRATESAALEHVMALFMMGFVKLLGAAVLLANARSATKRPDAPRAYDDAIRVHFLLGYACFFMGLALTWLGLRPVLVVIGLSNLADLFSWVLLLSVGAGAFEQSTWIQMNLANSKIAALVAPLGAALAAGAYRFVLVPLEPRFWPTGDTLAFVVVMFLLSAGAYTAGSLILKFHGDAVADRVIARIGRRWFPSYGACISCVLLLLWCALVMPDP